jgi:hypothetical protein
MADFSANWAMTIYAKLWAKFGTKSFSRKDAEKVVPKNNNLNQAFSSLKNDGWLVIGLDPVDGRKSIYTLRDPKDVVEQIGKEKVV